MSNAIVNGLAGAGGGLIAQLLTYPLQAVNTRQQTERNTEGGKGAASKLATGTLPGLSQVISEEGWGGLYRGLRPSLLGTAASQGVYYYFYQIFRNAAEASALENKQVGIGDGSVGMVPSLMVAAMAGCVNVLLTNPIWVIVTRMQTQARTKKEAEPRLPSYQGVTHTIRELYAEAGVLGFWKGVFPTLLMVSNPSIQFMIYETILKHIAAKRTGGGVISNISASEVFILGALSKLGATVLTYPILVVKSRLQAKQNVDGDRAYTGTVDAIGKMLQLEGVAGFYKGMSTKILQSVAAAAVLFMVKEELVKFARYALLKPRKPRRLTR